MYMERKLSAFPCRYIFCQNTGVDLTTYFDNIGDDIEFDFPVIFCLNCRFEIYRS